MQHGGFRFPFKGKGALGQASEIVRCRVPEEPLNAAWGGEGLEVDIEERLQMHNAMHN